MAETELAAEAADVEASAAREEAAAAEFAARKQCNVDRCRTCFCWVCDKEASLCKSVRIGLVSHIRTHVQHTATFHATRAYVEGRTISPHRERFPSPWSC
jgi:hypothetical protein